MRGSTLGLALLGALLACGDDGDPRASRRRPGGPAGETQVGGAEIDRLRALGYVDVAEDEIEDERSGVVVTRDGSSNDYNFYLSSGACRADLIDAAGAVLHSWQHPPCGRWASAALLPDGGLVVVGQHPRKEVSAQHHRRYLLRLSRDGTVLWEVETRVHHYVGLTSDGRILTLTKRTRHIPNIPPDVLPPGIPVKDNGVAVFSLDGELLEEQSLVEALSRSPNVFRFQAVAPRETERGEVIVDLLHTNAVQWVPPGGFRGSPAPFPQGAVLVCMRHQDTVALIDWGAQRAVWAWGQRVLDGPHDAHVVPGGNVLIFDNGLGRRWSRVMEVDPASAQTVWEYGAHPPRSFYSRIRGASQRLANGNTLISDSTHGRVFEVTASGELVWDFRTPHRNAAGKPYGIVFMRRYSAAQVPSILRPGAPSSP